MATANWRRARTFTSRHNWRMRHMLHVSGRVRVQWLVDPLESARRYYALVRRQRPDGSWWWDSIDRKDGHPTYRRTLAVALAVCERWLRDNEES